MASHKRIHQEAILPVECLQEMKQGESATLLTLTEMTALIDCNKLVNCLESSHMYSSLLTYSESQHRNNS